MQSSETLFSFSNPHPPITSWIMPRRHQQGTQSSFLPSHLREPFRGRLQRPPISPSEPIKASNSKLCPEYRGDCSNRRPRLETELLRRATTHNSCIQEGSVVSSCGYNEQKDRFARNSSVQRGERGSKCGTSHNLCAHTDTVESSYPK